jgi:mannosyltransferase OCH1-like enzyme
MNLDEPYNGNYVINGKYFVDTIDENSISKVDLPKQIVFFYNDINIVPNKVFYNWKRLNPNYKLIFFDFKDSAYFLEKKLGTDYKEHFNKITYAPHKSDFFRLCFLYVYGGIYSDIDNEPLKPIETFYNNFENIKFCTALALDNNAFAQAIICSTRRNTYLDICIKEYLNKFYSFKTLDNYKDQDLTGTSIMYKCIKKILLDHKQTYTNLLAHTQYIIYEDIDNMRFVNKLCLLDEYTPSGLWQECCMRTGYETVLKCRYPDYPWFGHDRNPPEQYLTNY